MHLKTCSSCGRQIEWRKKWANCWDSVKFCSDACRRVKPGKPDRQLEETILSLLASRAINATICPSEAARAVFSKERWQGEMERTLRAARRLVNAGKLRILQEGKEVEPSTAKGAIRLAKK